LGAGTERSSEVSIVLPELVFTASAASAMLSTTNAVASTVVARVRKPPRRAPT
jgi:hypothetical protein